MEHCEESEYAPIYDFEGFESTDINDRTRRLALSHLKQFIVDLKLFCIEENNYFPICDFTGFEWDSTDQARRLVLYHLKQFIFKLKWLDIDKPPLSNSQVSLKRELPKMDVPVSKRAKVSLGIQKVHDFPPQIVCHKPPPPSPVIIQEACCRIIPGYKAKAKLMLGQYLFTYSGESQSGKTWWKCDYFRCGYRIHTINGEIVKHVNPVHPHDPVPWKAEVEEYLVAMKERARTSGDPIEHIVRTFYTQAHPYWAHLLPSVDSVSRELVLACDLFQQTNIISKPTKKCPQLKVANPKCPKDSQEYNPHHHVSGASHMPNITPRGARNVTILSNSCYGTSSFHECELCWRRYPLQKQLQLHKRITHRVQNVPLLCINCGYLFTKTKDQAPWNKCCRTNIRKYFLKRAVL